MESIEDLVSTVVSHVSDAASSRAVAGDPIQLGEITIVVLSTLSVGMGAADAEGKNEEKAKSPPRGPESGLGEGAGGAVKVRPVGVIAFTPRGVEVLPIPAPPGVFDKIVERVPAVVDLVNEARQSLQSS